MDDPPPYSASQEGASNSQRPSAAASAPVMAVSGPVMQPGPGRFGGFRTESGFNPCCCCNSCCPGRSLKIGSILTGVYFILLGVAFLISWSSTQDKTEKIEGTSFNRDSARVQNLMRQTTIYAVTFLLNGLSHIPSGILIIIAAALNNGLAALIYCILSLFNLLAIIICGAAMVVIINGYNTEQYYFEDRDTAFRVANASLVIFFLICTLWQAYFTLVGVALRSYIKNEMLKRGVMGMGPSVQMSGVIPSNKPTEENASAA